MLRLHGGERGRPCGGGEDADPDHDALGRREHGGGLRDAAAEAEILDHPQLVEAERLGASGVGEDLGGRGDRGEQDSDGGVGRGGAHGSQPRVAP